MTTELDNVDVAVLSETIDSTDNFVNVDTMSVPQGASGSPIGSHQGDVPGSLVRPKRRVVGNANTRVVSGAIRRNYQVASQVIFTNYLELKNDMVSPDYAQEILEEVMTAARVDMSNSSATKMVEDVIFIFYVENGASSRTGYEKVVNVYDVDFDLMVVLNVLVSHGVTPRRFTRGLADRIFEFLRQPENEPLRADVVRRFNLTDPDDAAVAFDGSTHISGLPNEKLQVAHMLASRGIYENTASVKNANDRTTFDGLLTQSQMKSGALHLGGPQ